MNKTLINLVLAICLILVCVYTVPRACCEVGELDRVDTVRTVRIDTLRDTLYAYVSKPIPKYVFKIRTDTVYTSVGDTLLLQRESKIYQDTLCAQNDTAIVTSYIQGIDASLDSVKLELWKRDSIITNTVEVTRYVKKKGGITHGVQIRCWL